MSQNLRQFTQAVYAFDAVVQRTQGAAWQNATPCEGWNATDLVEHQIAVLNGVDAVASTGSMAAPAPPEDMSDPHAAWSECRDRLLATLDTEGVLGQKGPFWFGAETVDDMIGVVKWDAVTHAWDLATAIGQDPCLDDALVQACHDVVEPLSEMLVESKRTGPRLDPAGDASVLDRYLALVGRRSS